MQNISINFENSLIDIIGCQKTVSCLETCGFKRIEDFFNFNHDALKNIEINVRKFCKEIPRNQRELYLDPEYYDNPELFYIKPHIKERILNIQNQIAMLTTVYHNIPEQYTNDNNFKNANNTSQVSQVSQVTQVSQVSQVTHVSQPLQPQLQPPKLECISSVKVPPISGDDEIPKGRKRKQRNQNQNPSEKKKTPKKPKEEEERKMKLESESMHREVMRHAHAKFFKCDLEMMKHFRVFRDETDNRLGYYECLLCNGLSGKRIIKYRYATYGSLIFMNIQVHLEKHFSRVKPNNRQRLSRKERSPTSPKSEVMEMVGAKPKPQRKPKAKSQTKSSQEQQRSQLQNQHQSSQQQSQQQQQPTQVSVSVHQQQQQQPQSTITLPSISQHQNNTHHLPQLPLSLAPYKRNLNFGNPTTSTSLPVPTAVVATVTPIVPIVATVGLVSTANILSSHHQGAAQHQPISLTPQHLHHQQAQINHHQQHHIHNIHPQQHHGNNTPQSIM